MTVHLTHSGAYAQVSSMESTAKSEDNDFKRHYLPMIVMLGIGTVAFFMFKNLRESSADTIIFLVGGMLYFVNVIMGWTDENKAFKELPDEIATDSQVDALKLQKESFEYVLEIAEKRLKMQLAATTAFAAASVIVMLQYMKERRTSARASSGLQQATTEVSSLCSQMMVNPPVVDPRLAENPVEPLQLNCQRQTQQISAGLQQASATGQQIEAHDQTVIHASSLQAGDTYATLVERQSQQGARVDHPFQVPALPSTIVLHDYMNHKYYIEDPKKGIVYQLIPRKLERENNQNISYMERYFTDDELKDFTQEEIDFLNYAKLDMNIIDNIIATAHAQFFRTLVGQGGDTAANHLANEVGNAVGDAYEMEDNCNTDNSCGSSEHAEYHVQLESLQSNAIGFAADQAMGASTEVILRETGAGDALERGARNIDRRMRRGMSRAVGGRNPAARSARRRAAVRAAGVVGRFVMRRAAQVAIVAGAAVALGSVAPVVATVGILYTGYEVAKLGVEAANVYRAYTKTQMDGEAVETDVNDYGANMVFYRLRKKESFLENLIPKAYAFNGLEIAQNGQEALQETTSDTTREIDRWLYNPKGRMIIFGAITGLSAIITANTKAMIDSIKEDIEKIDDIISGMEDRQVEYSPLEKFKISLNEILDYFIDDANASKAEVITLNKKLPCMLTLKNKKCADIKKLFLHRTPKNAKTPETLGKLINTIAQTGNGINGQQNITPMTLKRVDILAKHTEGLLAVKDRTQAYVNESVRKDGQKPINFKGLENLFLKRVFKKAEENFLKHEVSERDIASITSGSVKQAKTKHKNIKFIPNLNSNDEKDDNNDSFSTKNNNYDIKNYESMNSSTNNTSYEVDEINKDSNRNLFNIISNRYLIIRRKRLNQ